MIDAHVHSTFSDGELQVEDIVKISVQKGCKVGISDHVGTMYPLNDKDGILNYLSFLKSYPVYKSLELNINENFPLPSIILDTVDYRIGGVHFQKEALLGIAGFSTADIEGFMGKITAFILEAMRERRIDILSHPTCLPNSIKEREEELFSGEVSTLIIRTAVENNVALEINSFFKVPNRNCIKKAVEMGAKISLGSDGHRKEQVCNLEYSLQMLKELNIPEKQIWTPEDCTVNVKTD